MSGGMMLAMSVCRDVYDVKITVKGMLMYDKD